MSPLEKILGKEPLFCFGTDLDWCSDAAIDSVLHAFGTANSKVTVFATHASPALAQKRDFLEIAVHPNFLPDSTHGSTIDDVINHVFGLYPQAKTYRSHSYYDSQRMTEMMAARGIRYDANICLYRQPDLRPLRHCHIEWRFPSWLDDTVHWRHAGSWQFERLKQELETPGLKIINIHPPCYALNIPNVDTLERHRAKLRDAGPPYFAEFRYQGHGPGTFLDHLLDWLKGRHPTYHFSDLNALHTEPNTPTVDPRLVRPPVSREIAGRPPIAGDYDAANEQQRMDLVRAQYDTFRERGKYATSRDYNNRELEIDGIRRNVTGNRVLDLGCGNGYTLLTLGSIFEAGRLIGVDFSQNMIAGALALQREEFSEQLKLRPEFICADVFRYLETIAPGSFDTIISERLVINLPSWEIQRTLIERIIDLLPIGGRYLVVEGSAQGFKELNEIRQRCGLAKIPDRYPGNESSNKIDENKLDRMFAQRRDVTVQREHTFGFYALASKVLHPLIVDPDEPKFASPINDRARLVQEALNDAGVRLPRIGASMLWVVEKRG